MLAHIWCRGVLCGVFGAMKLFEAGEAGFGFRLGWFGWLKGVFTDKHVDANCRTVNLMFFQVAVLRTGKLPYSKRFLFLIIYQSHQDHYK